MAARARLLGLLLCFGAAACGADTSEGADDEVTRAAVELSFDADPAVATQTAALRVRLLSLAALPTPGAALPPDEVRRTIVYDVFTWPETLRLPDGLLQEGEAFWVEATALDVSGRELTSTRLLSSPLAGRTLRPELVLHARCLDVICGARASTCTETGFCSSAIRAPEGLPSEPLD